MSWFSPISSYCVCQSDRFVGCSRRFINGLITLGLIKSPLKSTAYKISTSISDFCIFFDACFMIQRPIRGCVAPRITLFYGALAQLVRAEDS